MNANEILFTFKENYCFIKFVGETRFTDCGKLNSFINKTIKEKKCENFIFDLTKSVYLDSTTLGIIARTANYVVNNSNNKPFLFSTNNDINILLNSMGFDDVFIIINENVENENYVPVDQMKINCKDSRELILNAHKTLCEMNPKNWNSFKNVVKCLESG